MPSRRAQPSLVVMNPVQRARAIAPAAPVFSTDLVSVAAIDDLLRRQLVVAGERQEAGRMLSDLLADLERHLDDSRALAVAALAQERVSLERCFLGVLEDAPERLVRPPKDHLVLSDPPFPPALGHATEMTDGR